MSYEREVNPELLDPYPLQIVKPQRVRSMVPGIFRRMTLRPRTRQRIGNMLALILTITAVLCGVATYAALTETPPFGKDPQIIFWLLNIDLAILLILVTMIALRMVALFSGRRKGQAGAKLHVRLVLIFGLLAAAPAIIMTIFSATFFHYGLQSWFSDKVSNAIHQSEAFAEAYMAEHQKVIKADILAMANDLDRSAEGLTDNPKGFEKFLQTQSFLRNFSEAVIFDGDGRMVLSSGLAFSMVFETLPQFAIDQARQGEVVMLNTASEERIRALVRLSNFSNSYLFVGRLVDPMVQSRLDATIKAVEEYERLESERSGLQVKMILIFVVIALLLLLAAIWAGLILARQLAAPISGLIIATDRVRAGDLTARVTEEGDTIDEFQVLARAFNRMTIQIEDQRDELIAANRQLDQRRRFTETVLAGVSSGVIGLDRDGRITLANSASALLFQTEARELVGQLMTEILPDLEALLVQAQQKPGRLTQGEIAYQPKDGSGRRALLVRIAIELIGDQDRGAVLTFDDITELQSAQRKSAWADVARRIAHEIKNPLTPIQLSAERLKRKYLKQITEDPETFAQCTDTIIHHVGDIGRMVNEFSSFARMPEAVMKTENVATIIREMQVFQQQAHPELSITLGGIINNNLPLYASVDAHQFRQVLTNILQNAIDILPAGQNGQIRITVTGKPENNQLVLIINDNGPGLPRDVDPDRLTEPYVTHREKGTGLGLAIVKKIMDDHKGKIIMGVPEWVRTMPDWSDLGGATIILIFPLDRPADSIEAIAASGV